MGPYWNIVATKDGCDPCVPYGGSYGPDRCRYDCGVPSQSLYHVPRDVLNPVGQQNYILVFEEQGGDIKGMKLNQRN